MPPRRITHDRVGDGRGSRRGRTLARSPRCCWAERRRLAGRDVVTVRLWDEQVAAAYRESFAEFGREHPDIEVRVNVVPYKSYFDSLRTDVAGGGADDVFWLSNAYFAGYADNGRLLDIGERWGRTPPAPGRARWSPSSPAAVCCGGCRSSPTQASRSTSTPTSSMRRASTWPRWCGCAGRRATATPSGACWHASPWMRTETGQTHRTSTPVGSSSGATTRPTTFRAST